MTKEDKPAPLDSRFRGNDKKEFPRRPKGSEGCEETPKVAPEHTEQDQRHSEAAPEGLAKLRSKTKVKAKRRPAGLRSPGETSAARVLASGSAGFPDRQDSVLFFKIFFIFLFNFFISFHCCQVNIIFGLKI